MGRRSWCSAALGISLLSACSTGREPQRVAFVPPPPDPRRVEELSCLSQAIYFEARGETVRGMQAVGYVVLNRAGHDRFPDSVCGVIRQGGPKPPCQFSWYCDGRADKPRDPAAWDTAQRVAREVYDRKVPDPTQGALYFHQRGVRPSWRDDFQRTAEIEGHVYYRPRSADQI